MSKKNKKFSIKTKTLTKVLIILELINTILEIIEKIKR